jgi:hypothetical protein
MGRGAPTPTYKVDNSAACARDEIFCTNRLPNLNTRHAARPTLVIVFPELGPSKAGTWKVLNMCTIPLSQHNPHMAVSPFQPPRCLPVIRENGVHTCPVCQDTACLSRKSGPRLAEAHRWRHWQLRLQLPGPSGACPGLESWSPQPKSCSVPPWTTLRC